MNVMAPGLRKLALTIHVLCSVGWLGAVVSFLVLAVAGLSSSDRQLVRAAYLAMDLIAWSIILPLSLASLLSGIVQALGTVWGLFRHHWVLIKLVITTLATVALLVHMGPISGLADTATETTLSDANLRGLRIQVVVQAGAALLALLVATALSMYKPRGMTGYGQRKQRRVLELTADAGPAAQKHTNPKRRIQ